MRLATLIACTLWVTMVGVVPGFADSFRECANCPEQVVVPAGSFTMGSPESEKDRRNDEGPQHRVTIGKPFAVGKFHVTVDQFAAFVAESGYDTGSKCRTFEDGKVEERSDRSWRNPGFAQSGSHPAVCLNLNDAQAYMDWLARKTGKAYRLLAEAEWEYAARARTEPGAYSRYSFGDDENDLCRYGNGADQTAKSTVPGASNWTIAPCNDGYAYTSPVGSFAANAFGLYDMQGNAREWTEDAITTIIAARLRTARLGRPEIAVAVSSAAVPGPSVQGNSARPSASAAPPAFGAATMASGWRGR